MAEWVELHRVLPSQELTYCGACGAVIPRRALVGEDGRTFCGEACAELEARVDELRRRFPVAQRPQVAQ